MDRPPPGHGAGEEYFSTHPGRAAGHPGGAGYPNRSDFSGFEDPDPRPGHGDPADPGPVPAGPADHHYVGDWSDWMMTSDGYPPRPGGEPADPVSPEPRPGYPATPGDHVPAAGNAESAGDGIPGPDATGPSSARQRLRERLAPREATPPVPARPSAPPGRTRLVPVLLGAAAVAALAAAAYVQFAVVGADEPATATPAATEPGVFGTPGAGVPASDPNCPAQRTGNTVQGNGPGGTGSGPEAIFGFQHAYYVARSGEQARTLVAPESAIPPAADIQHGIDSIPPGTTHCIQITPGAFVGQYTVAITEYRPGSAPLGYNPQLVTTMRIGDRTLITGIGPMP
ncbi:hypothetical protein [Nocardia sp. NPDC019395]|uniref:hypothetical protein n=1 Tax=Nocardia sp. NPDC019395 TaxID=3154686 RepID=UPI0033F0B90A